jgi:hypothetical protein
MPSVVELQRQSCGRVSLHVYAYLLRRRRVTEAKDMDGIGKTAYLYTRLERYHSSEWILSTCHNLYQAPERASVNHPMALRTDGETKSQKDIEALLWSNPRSPITNTRTPPVHIQPAILGAAKRKREEKKTCSIDTAPPYPFFAPQQMLHIHPSIHPANHPSSHPERASSIPLHTDLWLPVALRPSK